MALGKLRALRHAFVAAVLTGALLPVVSTGEAAAVTTLPAGFVLQDTSAAYGLGIGDNGDFTKVDPGALRAHDINQPYGKILHLTADGKGVESNPYYDATNPVSVASKVFARGFRNPFRFTIDPNL